MKSLSIIIPFFNEEKNISELFSVLEVFFLNQNIFSLELVLVNDGSTDATEVLLRNFKNKHQALVKVISCPENKGKGFAVRTGMLQAKGDWRLFLDADLSVSLDEIKKIIPFMKNNCDIIIGSRVITGSSVLVAQGKIRKTLGQFFTLLANFVTDIKVSDFTCGFKCFSKKATENIFPNTKINRWTYDVELLYLARKYSLKVCEVGIFWKNSSETKVRYFRDITQSIIDLFRIILIHR